MLVGADQAASAFQCKDVPACRRYLNEANT